MILLFFYFRVVCGMWGLTYGSQRLADAVLLGPSVSWTLPPLHAGGAAGSATKLYSGGTGHHQRLL